MLRKGNEELLQRVFMKMDGKRDMNLKVMALLIGCLGICWVEVYGARPNVLFCIMDDASWAHMSAYGCEWVETPAFDRLAADGILFMNAYTPNAKCAPSRSSILTGTKFVAIGGGSQSCGSFSGCI